MRGPERTVVGGTVAALVAADRLLADGHAVRLVLPATGVAPGFAPLERAGRLVELGPRVFELDFGDPPHAPPPLAAYRAGLHGHRPFAPLVDVYVRELLGDDLVDAGEPALVFEGRIVRDLHFRVDLAHLPSLLGPARSHAVADEAAAARSSLGDAGVLGAGHDLWAMDLASASIANHGETFHRLLIAPLVEKLVPGGAPEVVAALSRKAWMPIFHPRTLEEAARGWPLGFRPDRRFHTTARGAGLLVERLLARVAARASVERRPALVHVEARGGGVRMRFADGGAIEASRPVIGAATSELHRAVGARAVPRLRTAVAWLEVDEAALRTHAPLLQDASPGPIFRVTRSPAPPGAGRAGLCVELRHDAPPDALGALAVEGVVASGIVSAGADVEIIGTADAPGPPAPTPDGVAAQRAAAERLACVALDAIVVGGAAGIGADTLNDQIVQGHAAAAEVGT